MTASAKSRRCLTRFDARLTSDHVRRLPYRIYAPCIRQLAAKKAIPQSVRSSHQIRYGGMKPAMRGSRSDVSQRSGDASADRVAGAVRYPGADDGRSVRDRLRGEDRDPELAFDVVDADRIDHAEDAGHQCKEKQQFFTDRDECARLLNDAPALRGAHEFTFLF